MAEKTAEISNSHEPDTLLTMREASRLLGVHANTLRRWGRTGLLKEYRIGIGRHRRFKHADLAVLLVMQRS